MALIYEVNIAVAADIADAYLAWLRGHVIEVASNDGFAPAAIFDHDGEDNRAHLVVQYAVRDRAALDAYFANPGSNGAAALRSDGLSRFGDRATITRRILQRL